MSDHSTRDERVVVTVMVAGRNIQYVPHSSPTVSESNMLKNGLVGVRVTCREGGVADRYKSVNILPYWFPVATNIRHKHVQHSGVRGL
ncbi:hypothetical protein Pcinc_041689 [Petrolisthes cinctipes]|uniref:Uncharacterized protein n=1 Tax=Petrolisthes cinctipes TaxID=88211 RepID=A0AAE1EGQ3_PETCI|nr:hypothetical protein Pcinc_041689 [Petrolisthes cinctipes]